jgi:uncharacterized protein YgbK (DUF1537 family)
MKVPKDELINSLPPEWTDDLFPAIRTNVHASGIKVFVLDDDPTGTQTVHDVPVLTEWSQDTLIKVFTESEPIAYILTNSRSVSTNQAKEMNREIASNLRIASQVTERKYKVISRSDSTLRGHFPEEVNALIEGIGEHIDGILIIPFFLEGGRITIQDIHYVSEIDSLVPAAETEFAKDTNFGYKNSNLKNWVSEKYKGAVIPQDVYSISISDIRTGGPDVIAAKLNKIEQTQVCVVNAATYRDMEVFVAGLLQAESSGKNFIYRTAASFVRVRGGIPPRELLTKTDLASKTSRKSGGLVIVGSYVQKSTDQLQTLESLSDLCSIEISVEKVLGPDSRVKEIKRVTDKVNETISRGLDAVIYTSRRLVIDPDQDTSLLMGQKISRALVEVVKGIDTEPAWIIAKGGITSSDIATQSLNIKRAQVLGQAIPGVPIWLTGLESRWPGKIYVVFPGNVGGTNALSDMVEILKR